MELRLAAPLILAVMIQGVVPPSAHAQDAGTGERLLRQRCAACHALVAGQNRVGPHLSGVIGRKAGSVEGARYSPALRESQIVWTEETLEGFLDYLRVVLLEQRADLCAELQRLFILGPQALREHDDPGHELGDGLDVLLRGQQLT